MLSVLLALLAGGGPENVLVVVNDLSPESLEIGRHYVLRRDVPRHHVVHVRIPLDSGRPLDTFPDGYDGYRRLLEDPVRAWLEANPDAVITTIALTRGIPVVAKLKGSGAERSTAHLLGLLKAGSDTHPKNDMQRNPFHRRDGSIDPADPAAPLPLYAVAMLSGFTAADAKRSIDLAVEAEEKKSRGTVILGKSAAKDPRGSYNGSFPALAQALEQMKLKTEIVEHPGKPQLLEGRKDVAFYMFGEANWDPAFPAKNTYVPGAVVDNLTSWGLVPKTFIAGAGTPQTPMPHFLAAGATAVHGAVSEPTTAAWDAANIHILQYCAGYNLVESYLMSHPVFPWMNLVVGDPLLQPYAERPKLTLDAAEKSKIKVSALALRAGATIREVRLYVDGRPARTAPGGVAEFELKDFDPEVNSWTAVAIEESKFRTQGILRSAPIKPAVSKCLATVASATKEKVVVKLAASEGTPVFSWHAPGAAVPVGVRRGKDLTLAYPKPAAARQVEIWTRNAKDDARVFLLDIP